MEQWDDIKPIESYDVDWKSFEKKNLVTDIFDGFFGWVNDSIEGRFVTLDEQRKKMLAGDPELNIKGLDDGYQLEADKLNAIQQRSSKGFQILDINPGLLNDLDNPLTLPYEFIFDGTNFIPDQNANFVKNFRSVNIPIAGTFLKIEFIYENNTGANLSYSPVSASPVPNRLVPKAAIKYQQAFATLSGEVDLVSFQDYYSFDNFARNKVYVDFGPSTGKPHIVPTSGRIFKTYFNEVNITLNIGAPKVRITIGFNSEVFESPSVSPINARLGLTGGARILADSDTVLAPMSVNDTNVLSLFSGSPRGIFIASSAGGAIQLLTFPLISNYGYLMDGVTVSSYGYSVLWISRITFKVDITPIPAPAVLTDFFRFNLYIQSINNPLVGALRQDRIVHSAKVSIVGDVYSAEFSEPIRVVIPAGSALFLGLQYGSTAASTFALSFSIDGYSLGEILNFPVGMSFAIVTSKFITDASFLSDFNRIYSLRNP